MKFVRILVATHRAGGCRGGPPLNATLAAPGAARAAAARLCSAPWLGSTRAHSLELLREQAVTVLPGYGRSSLLLGTRVGLGVALIGAAPPSPSRCSILPAGATSSGRFCCRWRLPAYVLAYATTDFLQYSGPLQTVLRELTGRSGRSGPTCAACRPRCCCSRWRLYPTSTC
jgi:iron(III) transport system permease protein